MKSSVFSPFFTYKADIDVKIRDYKKGDGEGVVELFLENYGNTYYKQSFYSPKHWDEMAKSDKYYPIIAKIDSKVVGQFLLTVYDEYIGEVGAVVVHPDYKGRGIMNKMFSYLLKRAQNLGLSSVYGEAIMFHPFSQKANLKQGMVESALQLGEVASWISQKDIKFEKRSGVLVSFKLFKKQRRFINIPKVYENIIKDVYKRAGIKHFRSSRRLKPAIKTSENHLLKLGSIIIDSKVKNFKEKFNKRFAFLKTKHDMIYADVNLKSKNIDEIVEFLNKKGFFYSGVLFNKYEGDDYLRLQYENTHNIEEKLNVCFSRYCKKLSRFVYLDKQRVSRI
ncbi:acetyltransferase, gnat family [Nautilia profundicola AmH]|uniref:Acetyltransferase, gnat family n=1 Tax=Nautilia profundicola (strain ATCC BAA-1463 / DSM 18972 / AmH) TaxID=598659 RepID=B9L8Q6_NAUPA|nr:GNAT family N-acetyltransferase [Nautilia profundicola]ACM93758.1 acetyltransferase, gnat family [Nautilia profundicola AmH]